MPRINDIVGKRFGYLVVVQCAGRDNSFVTWTCKCDCGKMIVVRGDKLRRGERKACTLDGHFWRRPSGIRQTYPAEARIWNSMRQRCRNPKNASWSIYGGRGVKVCERWNSFAAFIEDMRARPSGKHSLDRIDPNGNYEPRNCRWATLREQKQNLRSAIIIEYEGEKMFLGDLTQKLGLSKSVVGGRLRMGWTLEDALTIPVRQKLSAKDRA